MDERERSGVEVKGKKESKTEIKVGRAERWRQAGKG